MRLLNHPLDPGEGSSVLIAAGVIKEAGQLSDFLKIEDPLMAPTITLGDYTLSSWPGNGGVDHVYYKDERMFGNARGLPNFGINEACRTLKEPIRQLGELGIRTIVGVTNLPHEKPLAVIPTLVDRVAEELRATAVEINFSCPNGLRDDGSLHLPICDDAIAVGEVLEETRRRVGNEICLVAKDSSHSSTVDGPLDITKALSFFEVAGRSVNALAGINTVGNQPFKEITATNGRGGASGPIIVTLAREYLALAVENLPENVAVLSIGGVESSNAHIEIPARRGAGAMLVGGAQEFFRSRKPLQVATTWAIEAVYS